jgi:hypothetical protein
MLNHLERIHPMTFSAMGKARNASEPMEKDKLDESVRGTKLLFNLRTKQSRKDFLDQVIRNCLSCSTPALAEPSLAGLRWP